MMVSGRGRKPAIVFVLLFYTTVGLLAIGMITAVAVSDTEMMSCYSSGKQISSEIGELRQVEMTMVREGREQWRVQTALVAAVEVCHLRPPVVWGETPVWKLSLSNKSPLLSITTPTWIAEYEVIDQNSHQAEVALIIADTPKYILTLKKPFGNWWYVTDIRDMSRSGAGPQTPKGVHLVEVRPTMTRHGLRLTWDSRSKTAEVNGANVRATMQVGYNRTNVNGAEIICSACPMVIKGKVFAPEDLMSRIIAESIAK